jgi:hypothetical protein
MNKRKPFKEKLYLWMEEMEMHLSKIDNQKSLLELDTLVEDSLYTDVDVVFYRRMSRKLLELSFIFGQYPDEVEKLVNHHRES